MSVDVRLGMLLRQLKMPTVLTNYQKLAAEASSSGWLYLIWNTTVER